MERHHVCALGSSDVQQDPVALYQRGTSHAEKAVGSLKVSFDIYAPKRFSTFKIEAVQHAFCPKRVNPPPSNGRGRPRTIIESKFVLVPRRVGKAPYWAADSRIEAFNGFFVVQTVKQNQLVIGHHGRAKPMTNRLLPDDRRTVAGPGFGHIQPSVKAIASWTKELWPLGTRQFAGHGGSHTDQQGQKNSGLHREFDDTGYHRLE
jgi:hypothetical protein